MADSNKVKFGYEPSLPYAMEEAINRLRINIGFLGSDVRKILLISSEPNEGKSFVAFNLWKQMVQAGEKSILLDADLRKSALVETYGLEREDGKELKGTSQYLSGYDDLSEYILTTPGGNGAMLPNVDNVINPSMLIESDKFRKMLDYMAEQYRYVFVDAPPLGLVSDGERIGNMCDGAIITIRSGVTPKSMIRNSIRQLERAGCPVLGFVLNRVDTTTGGYYKKYYYGRGYYYGSEYYSK
ncbi:MAG: CpsD/CapB family tyrosine-protein kinase [Eubacterium sp.]|nr:CpsD/CapB family tyrosine-protein kinase [Eubacterium sp.]